MSYPALTLLVQAYLTLDWPDDYPDVWAAVDDYITNEPLARDLPDEISKLIGPAPSEENLRAIIIGDLGCGYLPDADGSTMTDWILAVRDRVQTGLGE